MRLSVLYNALLITSAALTEHSCSSSACIDEDPVGNLSLLQTRIVVENTQACVPYSQDACEMAAIQHGLERGGVGYSFAGDYNTKGCYTYTSGQYQGHAYYGTGGSESDRQATPSSPKVRILGDHCEACVPYSQDACQLAAMLHGLECGGVGYNFAGNYGTKGCYTYTSGQYQGHAYYGTGGAESDRQATPNAPKTRISGDDCQALLRDNGEDGCTPSSKCAACHGDCDTDDDCNTGLRCFIRSGTPGTIKVYGCATGGPGDVATRDFCFEPPTSPANGVLINLGELGCTTSEKCETCQGDCDTDDECDMGLRCFTRSGKSKVLGCHEGGDGDVDDYDYCFDPLVVQANTRVLQSLGEDGCTQSDTCNACIGDCDSDADCTGELKCFHRTGNTQVPGCEPGGYGDIAHADFCYDDSGVPAGPVTTQTTQNLVAGATTISVLDTTGLYAGMSITISDGSFVETKTIVSVNTGAVSLISDVRLLAAGSITIDSPLQSNFDAGATVTATPEHTKAGPVTTATTEALVPGTRVVPVQDITGLSKGMSLTIALGPISETKTIVLVSTAGVSLLSEIRLAAAGTVTVDSPLVHNFDLGASITARVEVVHQAGPLPTARGRGAHRLLWKAGNATKTSDEAWYTTDHYLSFKKKCPKGKNANSEICRYYMFGSNFLSDEFGTKNYTIFGSMMSAGNTKSCGCEVKIVSGKLRVFDYKVCAQDETYEDPEDMVICKKDPDPYGGACENVNHIFKKEGFYSCECLHFDHCFWSGTCVLDQENCPGNDGEKMPKCTSDKDCGFPVGQCVKAEGVCKARTVLIADAAPNSKTLRVYNTDNGFKLGGYVMIWSSHLKTEANQIVKVGLANLYLKFPLKMGHKRGAVVVHYPTVTSHLKDFVRTPSHRTEQLEPPNWKNLRESVTFFRKIFIDTPICSKCEQYVLLNNLCPNRNDVLKVPKWCPQCDEWLREACSAYPPVGYITAGPGQCLDQFANKGTFIISELTSDNPYNCKYLCDRRPTCMGFEKTLDTCRWYDDAKFGVSTSDGDDRRGITCYRKALCQTSEDCGTGYACYPGGHCKAIAPRFEHG